MYQDYPVFPAASELLALWPLWLLFGLLAVIWLCGVSFEQQTTRWMALKRRDDLRRLEEERHRESVVK